MTASRQSHELVDLFKRISSAVAADPNISMGDRRAVMEHLGDATAEPGGVDYIEVDAAGIPAMWAVPKNCAKDRVLLCAHGGGYISGSMYSHRKMYGHYAKKIGCRALIVNYRLAPESRHPVQVNDMADSYIWLLGEGVTPNHLAIAGDSAGGSLAITTMVRLRERGAPLPVASMALSPWVDMELTEGSFVSNKDNDALVSREMAEYMASNFLGENGSRRDPLANPLFADLHGLPPVYIQAGGFEVLLDDSRMLAEALKNAHVDVKLDVFPEMQHLFYLLAGTAPEADEAITRTAKWIRPKLDL